MIEAKPTTPLMKQYLSLKEIAHDGFLLFRLGDFYELFGSDAVKASQVLGITLTTRDKKSAEPLPMAGIPYHSSESYIERLLNTGVKVYVAEQTETPEEAFLRGGYKAIVERKITQVHSPALRYSDESTQKPIPRRLASALKISRGKNQPPAIALVLIEPSRGEVFIQEFQTGQEFVTKFELFHIAHFVEFKKRSLNIEEFLNENHSALSPSILVERIPEFRFSDRDRKEALERQYSVATLDSLIPQSQFNSFSSSDWIDLLGGLLCVLQASHPGRSLSHLQKPKEFFQKTALSYNSNALYQLDLFPKAEVPGFSLLESLSPPQTRGGIRLLRDWIFCPLTDAGEILKRRSRVYSWMTDFRESIPEVYTHLQQTTDLLPLLARFEAQNRHRKDVGRIHATLKSAYQLRETLSQSHSSNSETVYLQSKLNPLQPLSDYLFQVIRFDTHGDVTFNPQIDTSLDQVSVEMQRLEEKLKDLEEREKVSTGITTLKVKFNRVFGYGIEVSTANLKNIPGHYQRKQTLAGGERFVTPELLDLESKLQEAKAKRSQLEARIEGETFEKIHQNIDALRDLSHSLHQLDAILSLAETAQRSGWCFAEILPHPALHIQNLRHAILESKLEHFIPNPAELGSQGDASTLLLTGPNMGGKSTYMKQIALAVILNQIGAPIPATSARMGLFKKLRTRMGAHDSLSKGQSTFMVEMLELAAILQDADQESLLLLDEVGRGTSTYDGMSLAQSVLEELTYQAKSCVLFATHYHELTALAEASTLIKNGHFTAQIRGQKLVFDHRLQLGKAKKSFGLEVAQMAGVSTSTLSRARQIQKQLEKTARFNSKDLSEENFFNPQMSLFQQSAAPSEESLKMKEFLEQLSAIDPNALSPRDAWAKLEETKNYARSFQSVSPKTSSLKDPSQNP